MNRAVEVINRIKGLLEKDVSPKTVDPLSRK